MVVTTSKARVKIIAINLKTVAIVAVVLHLAIAKQRQTAKDDQKRNSTEIARV